ncbi:TIM-barrel domain-containing protein [Roseateles cellulosilyticus]|uniref:PA14 domain-containing protein n=1 Tax=Pelomonas cellulosilytica TaxID=2906762 RepID=A0ABS8XRS1_9BURK|nr:TIM-barrel domain-containing protein [Pelomonas sp. P8]MCE4555416.1 PA14 domain-containing protein [Pelomonas sp. P8]
MSERHLRARRALTTAFTTALVAGLLAVALPAAQADTGLDALGQPQRLPLAAAAQGLAWKRLESGVQLQLGALTRNVLFYGPGIVRVTTNLGESHATQPSLVVVAQPQAPAFDIQETADTLVLASAALRVQIDRRSGALAFQRADGSPLTREQAPAALKPASFSGAPTYTMTQAFSLAPDESLYGLGQYNEPYWDYRGRDVLMVQTNIGIVLPFMVSTRRWGVLWDVYSKMRFTDDAQGARFWAESAPAGADYYLVAGSSMDDVMAGYRHLTGAAPMFPKSAFGLFMSKERYQTQAQVLDVVRRFRADHFPLDNIVQDWQYWGGAADGTWSGMIWDASRYPDPRAMIDTLHRDLHAQFMISIWPSVGNNTALARELDAHGLRFGPMEGVASQAQIYDAFSAEGREIYFRHLKKGLLDVGVDALWMDGTEVEVSGAAHDPGTVERDIKAMGRNAMGDFARYLNVYSLLTTRGVYEGQRALPGPRGDQRVLTLTRSAWAGQQRYGAFAWSGDTRASWATFRAQISGGLNVGMGGQPYWTQDTGGFFVSYPGGERNPAYRELFARWHQFGIFNPVYRIHGTDVVREPYHFKTLDPAFYRSLRSAAELRYRLLPYHYGLAWRTHNEGYIPMRGLAMDFPDETALRGIDDAFMFGPAFLVRPVTRSVQYPELPRADTVPATALRTPEGQPGLAVTYYDGTHFDREAGHAVDNTVDHNWPEPPLSSFPPGLGSINNFSARWQGQLVAPEAGEYEIGLEGDDGFRLWLDDKLVIDDWKNGATRRQTAKVVLQKDRPARVRVEFYQGGGERSLRLSWRTPAQLQALADEQARIDPRIATRLPSGSNWFDFWSGQLHAGGSTVKASYPLDRFPLFVRAGSIVPMGPVVEHVSQKPDAPLEVRVYAGADAEFTLYEDDGQTYAYEKGQRATVTLRWDDARRVLHVSAREGRFPGLVERRRLDVKLIAASGRAAPVRHLDYRGLAADLQFPAPR